MANLPEDREELTDYFRYLDNLRVSGATNMYGAAPWLEGSFDELDMRAARAVHAAWMDTFDGKTPIEDRVTAALESASA